MGGNQVTQNGEAMTVARARKSDKASGRGRLMPERGPRVHAEDLPPDDGLVAMGLRKSFGRRPVVRGVNLSVKRGEAVGLLGPNGAGKTTVFYMITGLIAADQGTISLDGTDITTLPMYQRARLGIGYLPQESSIFRGLTVEDNIRAVLELVEPSRKRRESELLDEFSVSHLRHSPAVALSGGERRRVEIARALATRPQFMLLDEPFAGIDPIAIGDIRQLVRQLTARRIGVLITDHYVRETLELIDRALIIHEGEVLTAGTPHEIVASALKDDASAEARLATLDIDLDNVYQGEARGDAESRAQMAPSDSSWASLKPTRALSLDQEGLDIGATLTRETTLAEHLTEQLMLAISDPADRLIGQNLVGMVNEAGYLVSDPAAVAEMLGTSVAHVERVLAVLQGFDPAGVFARDLKECLKLQLKERDRLDPAMMILVDHL